ncbi:MAG: pseudouridine synthase [Candidatus Paceibacteria bacterium]
MSEKLQNYIARCGYTSRRKAETFIAEGRVQINHQTAHIGDRVSPEDDVYIDGHRLSLPQQYTYLKIYKPVGYVCTHSSFNKEHSILELLPQQYHHLSFAGRLDKDSSGLVLASDDGDFINRLAHPSHEHEKEYDVAITPGISTDTVTKRFLNGIQDNHETLRAKHVFAHSRTRYQVILTTGKNRQIRRMFDVLNQEIQSLIRTRIATYTLGNLSEAEYKHIPLHQKEGS